MSTGGLVVRYGAQAAVDGLDLRVRTGEIYGLLGPNGAGKSSVVRVLCTLRRPSAGWATVAGYDVVAEAQQVRMRIGVALQEAALDDRQTGRELLALQGRLYGLRAREVSARLAEITDLVDIGTAMDRRVGTYSGGMKRRLDLAASLVHNPEVIFLDEPTTGLDPTSRTAVWEEIRKLNAELGMTVLLTTQYLDEADVLADRLGVMSGGQLVAEGPPAALKRTIGRDLIVAEVEGDLDSAVEALRKLDTVDSVSTKGGRLLMTSSDGPASVSPVALALDRAPLEVHSLTLRTPTLDDVFRELTGSRLGDGSAASR